MGDCTRGVATLCAGLRGRLDATGLIECECELEESEFVMAGLIGGEGELPGEDGEEALRPRVPGAWRGEELEGRAGGTGGCWRATLLLVGAA